MPSSAATMSAALEPMSRAVLYGLAPTFAGQMERSSGSVSREVQSTI